MCRRCDAFAEQSISVTPRNLGSNPSRLVKISIQGVKLIFTAGFELSPKAKFESQQARGRGGSRGTAIESSSG